MCYARTGDEDEEVQLSLLRAGLEREVSARTGADFAILADPDGLAWREHWQRRVEERLDADTMLLVIVAPALFDSARCRQEIARFREREEKLGRDDLILPVYYVAASAMGKRILRQGDDLARLLRSRPQADWRDLRATPMTSPGAREAMTQLASQIAAVLAAGPGGHAVHVVGAGHRGAHASVSAAIKAARPGDQVLVWPGTYTDALVIDKPLEISGVGRREDIVIRVRDNHAVTLKASGGRIANLTIRQAGGERTWWNGVTVSQGELDIDGCDISCPTQCCVVITKGAAGHVRRSVLHHAKSMGVSVYAGRGTVEDSEIFATGSNGVVAGGGADVTVRRNRIRENAMNAVFVYNESSGTVEDNALFGNGSTGVTICDGGTAVVRRNQIDENGQCGVVVAGGSGTVEDNDIVANMMWGVIVRENGHGVIRRNRVTGNRNEAIHLNTGGSATVEDNDLTGNARGAWSITEDCEQGLTRARNKE
jgi:F-box protein 11